MRDEFTEGIAVCKSQYDLTRHKILALRAKAAKDYRKQNPWPFRLGDATMLLGLLFHGIVYILTNALVAMKEPTIQFVESNPVTASLYQLETSWLAQLDYFAFSIHLLLLAGVIFGYLTLRNNITNHSHMKPYVFLIVFNLLVTFLDMSNNLGYYLGGHITTLIQVVT